MGPSGELIPGQVSLGTEGTSPHTPKGEGLCWCPEAPSVFSQVSDLQGQRRERYLQKGRWAAAEGRGPWRSLPASCGLAALWAAV